MNRYFLYILILFTAAACKGNCEQEYLKYYKNNTDKFMFVRESSETVITMRYLPFGLLPGELQNAGFDAFYFTIEVKGENDDSKVLLSKSHFSTDDICYLKDADSHKNIYPEFIQPEITGVGNSIRYLVSFAKKDILNNSYFFVFEDFFLSKTGYSFPLIIEDILSLENRYCISYDQK